ncbi:MAG: DNA-directed RNA polymerase subunit M [Agathobacter sp.]|nr:DNA-directed RNA polymerase subunit M [Agathobacter sp.]
MVKVFICPECGDTRLASRRKVVECFGCGNEQMKPSNLTLKEFSNLSEEDRANYIKGWLYIQSRKKNQ